MKKVLALVLVLAMIVACACACTSQTPEATETSSAQESTSTAATQETASAVATESGGQYFKAGYSAITMNGDFFVDLAEGLAQSCVDKGLIEKTSDLTVLDAAVDSAKEVANMDSFITGGYDLIFVDSTNPDTICPLIDQATEAGATVVCVDSYITECSRVTVCYSDNFNNGFQVGKAFAESLDENQEIYSILLSGVKGNSAGEERRTGLIAGVLSIRLGLDKDAALTKAKEMNDTLIANGSVENTEAKFTIGGQGWGSWSKDGIMKDANDLVVKTQGKLNLVMAENDEMLFGGMQAAEDAGLTDGIQYIAAADGEKKSFDLIKDGKIFAVGLNSPSLVGELGAQVAYEVLVEGKDPTSYPDVMTTEAVAVTAANVDQYYDFGF